MSSKHLFAFLGSLILILGVGTFLTFQEVFLPQKKAKSQPIASPGGAEGSIRSSNAVSVGPRDAKVTVVEFLDFQCPFCRTVHPTFMRIMKEYERASVRFEFRHFPLLSIHPFALMAANASLCAHEQNTFLPYYDILYTKQDEISNASIVTFAGELGLNLQQFNTCLAEKRYEQYIRQDVKDGLALGIEGTPTWFVNNTRLVGVLPYEALKTAIEKELQQ